MSSVRTILILIVAAFLEVGGDALIRRGLPHRLSLLLAGAVSLFAYGVLVNQGGVDFSRLLGGYIAVFFVVAQIVAVVAFGETLPWRTIVGGILIVTGGLLLLS